LAIITLTSDYGIGSHYIGALKGAIYSKIPGALVIDISHQTAQYNHEQLAYVLSGVYKDFPKGTWHLLAIDTSVHLHKQILVIEHDGHFFIGADNTVFNYLFEITPTKVYRLLLKPADEKELFPEKNIFIDAIAHHIKKGDLKGIAEPAQIKRTVMQHAPFFEANILRGRVIFVDTFDNAHTNISKTLFDKHIGDSPFKIHLWKRSKLDFISTSYQLFRDGDEVAVFNSNGFLEIGMSRGRGAQLMGLSANSKIFIEKLERDDS